MSKKQNPSRLCARQACDNKPTHLATYQHGGTHKDPNGWLERVKLCERHASEVVAGANPPRALDRLPGRRPPPPEPQGEQLLVPGTEDL